MAFSNNAKRESQEDTSLCTNVVFGSSEGGGLTSALTTFAPRDEKSDTVARPMPEEPPDSCFFFQLSINAIYW